MGAAGPYWVTAHPVSWLPYEWPVGDDRQISSKDQRSVKLRSALLPRDIDAPACSRLCCMNRTWPATIPDPVVGHRLIAYDAGLPKSLIRFSTLHARTASAPCPAELRARKPSPMLDVYRKKTFSTRACRW